MRYLGMDVHVQSTVWHLLDSTGDTIARGSTPTTPEGLSKLIEKAGGPTDLLAGQEVGKVAYFVRDVLDGLGVALESFNANHLRMICSSRKKSDRRDAYWIAKVLQTGMKPHPVYLPAGEIRDWRILLARRDSLLRERRRWLLRAHSHLHRAGFKPKVKSRTVARLVAQAMEHRDGLDHEIHESLMLCQRMDEALLVEHTMLDAEVVRRGAKNDDIKRLMTIPSFGPKVAPVVFAWVGDVSRFPNARQLCSYAGLVPSVRQSGNTAIMGRITRQGSAQLRCYLVQAAHVLMWRCKNDESYPLRAIADRIRTHRTKRKIAAVAMARHLLRISFYILRDETAYDASMLSISGSAEDKAA